VSTLEDLSSFFLSVTWIKIRHKRKGEKQVEEKNIGKDNSDACQSSNDFEKKSGVCSDTNHAFDNDNTTDCLQLKQKNVRKSTVHTASFQTISCRGKRTLCSYAIRSIPDKGVKKVLKLEQWDK
jgi:hypothetical protein